MNIQFRLNHPSKDVSGIYVQFYFREFTRGRFHMGTGYKIRTRDWNKKQQFPSKKVDPELHKLRESLEEIRDAIESVFKAFNREGREFDNKLFKQRVKQQVGHSRSSGETRTLSLIGFIQSFIEENPEYVKKVDGTSIPTKRSKGTVSNYSQLLNHLIEFDTWKSPIDNLRKPVGVDFDTMDDIFYSSFMYYLKNERGLSNNTRGKIIRTLKSVLNKAYREGYDVNRRYNDFVVIAEKKPSLYFTFDQIKLFQGLDLSDNPRLDRVRDMFVFMCYTGLRISDAIKIRGAHVKEYLDENERIYVLELDQTKSTRPVAIPIFEDNLSILKKYEWNCPGHRADHGRWKAISPQKFNAYLKELGALIPVEKRTRTVKGEEYEIPLEAHTGRRSFCTNYYLTNQFTVDQMISMSGHANHKTFFGYIGIDDLEDRKRMFSSVRRVNLQSSERPLLRVAD